MNKMVLIFAFLILPVANFAADENVEKKEFHNLDQMLTEVKLEKIQVENMVDIMVKSGRITHEEGERARREIASVQEEDLESLKKEAMIQFKSGELANK